MILMRYANVPGVCTLGVLVSGSSVFYTLEPPWRDNQRNISCIPPGVYDCDFMERSASGKYRGCFHVKNVQGRSAILIHNGNTASNTKGCILVGKKSGRLAGMPAVLNSKSALIDLAQCTNHHNKLRIMEWNGY